LTNLQAMLIVIFIWLAIAMHALGVLPHAVDHAIMYVYEQPTCDCSTDMECQERCGGEY